MVRHYTHRSLCKICNSVGILSAPTRGLNNCRRSLNKSVRKVPPTLIISYEMAETGGPWAQLLIGALTLISWVSC
jgi:hypothetical protein